jgi:hypothetical protein
VSYRVVIRAVGKPKDIAAKVFFGTVKEAHEFGRCSVIILEHYVCIDEWRVEESDLPPNHALINGTLRRISTNPC